MIEPPAIVHALADEPANPELLALIADTEMHAPSLIDYEVASVLRGHALGGKLTVRQLEGRRRRLQLVRHHSVSAVDHDSPCP